MKSRSIYTCERGIMHSCMHMHNHIQAANPCSLAPLGMPWNDPITQFDLKDFDSEKNHPSMVQEHFNNPNIATPRFPHNTFLGLCRQPFRGPDTYTDPGRQSRNCSAVSQSPSWRKGRGSPSGTSITCAP